MLALLREGLSNEQIARRLGISLDGVKFHVSEILGKLGVSNRNEAAAWQREQPRTAAPSASLPYAGRRRGRSKAAGISVVRSAGTRSQSPTRCHRRTHRRQYRNAQTAA